MSLTIKASVSEKLLSKADRLFTGTTDGRIIEILQNARRAGATAIDIKLDDEVVTVTDNGHGISDFSKLLDLGNSGWKEETVASEDPGGVGLFCLMPRKVTVRSGGFEVCIEGEGWTGATEISIDPSAFHGPGTQIEFSDKDWTNAQIECACVFLPIPVILNGKKCEQHSFMTGESIPAKELGCKILVCGFGSFKNEHFYVRNGNYGDNVLINFHGQVISFRYDGVSAHNIAYLVEMTDDPTSLRMMLPARTRLVENEAYHDLLKTLKLSAYRYIQAKQSHKLPYSEYKDALDHGIVLPEATPTFDVGLLSGSMPDPPSIADAEAVNLAECYIKGAEGLNQVDDRNAHWLGVATRKLKHKFIPVTIASCYHGYSWAKLPTITKITATIKNQLKTTRLYGNDIIIADQVILRVTTSDGQIFEADSDIGFVTLDRKIWMVLSKNAHDNLTATDVWYHLGGYCEDGDAYDTQELNFEEAWDDFWARMSGPNECFRRKIVNELFIKEPYISVIINNDGCITIMRPDGSVEDIKPSDQIIASSEGDA